MEDVCTRDSLLRFPCLEVRRKTGNERFHHAGVPLDFDVLSFWQWSASDLISNALRGRVAEYLVAQAVGAGTEIRAEWDAYDLRTQTGTTIEVKSAAYLQTWAQAEHSKISFSIAPTRRWDPNTNRFHQKSKRQAELYVFALLAHRDKNTLDPLDVAQWSFFVLPTQVLDTKLALQKRISYQTLMRLRPTTCTFDQLGDAIRIAEDRCTPDFAPVLSCS